MSVARLLPLTINFEKTKKEKNLGGVSMSTRSSLAERREFNQRSDQTLLANSVSNPPPYLPLSADSSRSVAESGFRLSVRSDPAGKIEVPGVPDVYISIHLGPSVEMICRRGGSYHKGVAVHGDIDIIPAGTRGIWELTARDKALLIGLSPQLMNRAAEESNIDPQHVEIRNRFHVRDPQLENIAWALKAEMESGYPCGRPYLESLAYAVAVRLVHSHSSLPTEAPTVNGRLSGRKLKDVLSYIEENLGEDISLVDIALVAGLSVSHFKKMFRDSVGIPVHQYLIRRRVERAKELLVRGELSISQIAFDTGFAHQSHLARHMRRLLGTTPRELQGKLE